MNRDEIRQALSGAFPSLRAPFNTDDSIDFNGLANLIEFCIGAGSKSLMLTYGDSLYSLLTDDEVAEVTRFTVERAAGRAMVIAADRQWATPKEVEFARYCREVGADMLMVLPPDWAGSCTTQTLVEHYSAVAEHIPVMMVTNLFLSRGATFGMRTVEACLEQVENIAAIKDDMCGSFARQMTVMAAERCAVVAGGQKQNHLDIAPYGCVGYLSTFITFLPRIAHEYWHALASNDMDAAAGVIKRYDMPLFEYLLQLEGGFDAGMHALGELYGIYGRHRRRPYHTLSDAQVEQFREKLVEMELL